MARVGARLAAGAKAYGNTSLRVSPLSLAGEVEEELLDVAGWGFLLWLRLRHLRRRLPSTGRNKGHSRGIVRRTTR